jgi:hypothetical protein
MAATAPDYSGFVNTGLTGVQDSITNNTNPAYPTYMGNQKTNPYAQQQSLTGMNDSGYQVGRGIYGGLGRNAASIRNDYQTSVDQSWNKAQGSIRNMYGANGLYGSMGGGLMSGVVNDGAQNYATASAQGRMAADQTVMADEIARANSYRDAYDMQHGQNRDMWQANQTANDYNNQLLGNRTNFGNQQIDSAYQDQLARRDDSRAFDQLKIENYLGLAGGGSPMAGSQMAANAQQSAAKQAASSANTGAWLGASGSLAGGLLGGIGNAGGWSNFWG